jgi:hypothetical protein
MSAVYKITVEPKGKIKTELVSEAVVGQTQACNQIITLMRNAGRVTSHDDLCERPVPVNINTFTPQN